MSKNIKNTLIAILISSFLCASGTVFAAQTLRIASGLPPMQPANNPLYTEFQKLLPKLTNGRIKAQMVGMEVVNLANMRSGLNSGLVQIGLFLPAYFPADLPNFNLIGDLSLMGGNPQATSAAMTEYIVTCAECQAELQKLGLIYTGSHSNPYSLLTTKKVTTANDLTGMRIRVATPQHARWVEALGGTPVNMPTGEAFEALSQGIIEGTITSISDLISFNLQDVIKSVTLINMGTFHSLIDHAIKKDTWTKLSTEDKSAILLASTTSIIKTVDRWVEMRTEGIDIAQQKNITLVEPDNSLVKQTKDFTQNDIAFIVEQAESRFKINQAEEKVRSFQSLVAKWEKLIAQTDGSETQIQTAIQQEVWDKVNLEKYGL